MNLIQKYLLPKEIDFNAALQKQAAVSQRSVQDLASYCLDHDKKALKAILRDAKKSRKTKSKNMQDLLDVFITPYDKESIYRLIVQLDWIVLSVKHLTIDIEAYKVRCHDDYAPIFTLLTDMMTTLTTALAYLPEKKLSQILAAAETIHDNYDETARQCALAAVKYLEHDDIKAYLSHKEILSQLKDVSRHIHISANSLEDMAMKIV